MKWREVILSTWTDLKSNFKDADIQLYQVLYWTVTVCDRLKSQHIAKAPDGFGLHEFDRIPVHIENYSNRKYFELPEVVYDFPDDKGLDFVSYDYYVDECNPPFTSVTFTRTSPTKARRLYYNEEEKPTPQNPYWYRIKDKVYLLGVGNIDLLTVDIGLYGAFNIRNVRLDDECEFPQELLAVAIPQVYSLGRWTMQVPKDLENSGSDNRAEQQQPKGKQQQAPPQPQEQQEQQEQQ
jgi:hypothetical protein